MEAINDSSVEQREFFIDGPGGTGKTFLYNTLLAKVRSQGRVPLAVAFSGIAALLLTGGRTVHSRLKVLIPLIEISVCNIPKQSALAKLIHKASLLVWDEAPMVYKHAAECIDRTLRDLSSCELPFGGKIIVWRRFPPDSPGNSALYQSSGCICMINRISLWHHVEVVMKFTINMRLQSLDIYLK